MIRSALAFDHAVPLRMFREIFLRWHKRIKRVRMPFVFDAAAQFLAYFRKRIVCAVMHFPGRLESSEPKWRTIFEHRLLAHIQLRDLQSSLRGHVRRPWRPPAHATLLLQKTAYGIKRPSRTPTRQKQLFSFHSHHQLFPAETREIQFRKIFRSDRTRPDDNRAFWDFHHLRHLEFRTCDLPKRIGQFTHGCLFRFSSASLLNQNTASLSVLSNLPSGLEPRRHQKESEHQDAAR